MLKLTPDRINKHKPKIKFAINSLQHLLRTLTEIIKAPLINQ